MGTAKYVVCRCSECSKSPLGYCEVSKPARGRHMLLDERREAYIQRRLDADIYAVRRVTLARERGEREWRDNIARSFSTAFPDDDVPPRAAPSVLHGRLLPEDADSFGGNDSDQDLDVHAATQLGPTTAQHNTTPTPCRRARARPKPNAFLLATAPISGLLPQQQRLPAPTDKPLDAVDTIYTIDTIDAIDNNTTKTTDNNNTTSGRKPSDELGRINGGWKSRE